MTRVVRLLVLLLAGLMVVGCRPEVSGSDPAPTPSRSSATSGPTSDGDILRLAGTIQHAGVARAYFLDLPAAAVEEARVPPIVAMHGLGGSAETLAAAVSLAEPANRAGMAVVWPQGIDESWNAGPCCGGAQQQQADDVGFLIALIDELAATQPIDASNVHLAGHSNGGMMAYRFACDQPDRVVSVAAVGSLMVPAACTAAEPVSVLAIHSANDTVVPPFGGQPQGTPPPGVETLDELPTLDEVVTRWAELNGCTQPDETLAPSGLLERTWSDCEADSRVRMLLASDGDHGWPTGPDAQVDASAEIVEFVASSSR